MTTTEDLRRWAVEIAIRAGSSYDALDFAQRLVDFVSPPGDESGFTVPADFGKRANEAAGVTITSGMGQSFDWRDLLASESKRTSGEVARDAIAEREAIANWLGLVGRPRLSEQVRAGAHHA